MRETEITVQIYGEEEDVVNNFVNLGFKVVRRVKMSDYYFSKFTTEELLAMTYAGIMKNSFLVRKLEGDTNKVILHYKDKEFDEEGNVISEEKLAEPLVNAESAIKIFKSAKLNNWCNIVQDMYIFNGNGMEFALQVVGGMGIFVEYEEDESVAGLEPEEKVKKMVARLKALNLNLGEDYSVKKVYQKFLMETANSVAPLENI